MREAIMSDSVGVGSPSDELSSTLLHLASMCVSNSKRKFEED